MQFKRVAGTLLFSSSVGFIAAGAFLYAFPVASSQTPPPSPSVIQAKAAPTDDDEPTGSLKPKDSLTLKLLQEGMAFADKGDGANVDRLQKRISDEAGRALLEWAYLRSTNSHPSFSRLKTFLQTHNWPGESPIRFKAEQTLLSGGYSANDAIGYFGKESPEWPQGRIALAEALRKSGDKERAAAIIRDTWRDMDLSSASEKEIETRFPGVITRADTKYRMDRNLYEEKTKEALRIATSLGGPELAIAEARIAVIKKAPNVKQLLDKVPAASQQDAGYIFSKIQWLRREERDKEALALMLKVPRDIKTLIDGDEWWVERRILARTALDHGDPRTAYQIASQHTAQNELERMEAEFHAGWIAFRFLHDARTADKHFQALCEDAERPISVSRGAYWRGRVAESLGKKLEAQKFYSLAAEYPTTYYGQLSRAKAGGDEFTLRAPPKPQKAARNRFEQNDTVRALRWLMALNETDKARMFVSEMAKTLKDSDDLAMLAKVTEDMKDIRIAVLVGKQALYLNVPLETYAFPTHGIPEVTGSTDIERAMALAIARQESVFDPNVKSQAGATGLFQLLPGTAAAMAKHNKIPWSPKKITDPTYNTRLGVAYLNKLVNDLGGSYVLTFAAYNAGPGNVKKWIQKFGDPRDPGVDPVDWVERIPFTETRNYVMRVMENLQVYRARMKISLASALVIDSDLRRGQLRP